MILAWAESEKLFGVALHYADAWAYVDHRNARAAATAGQFCTRAASHGRAEEWLIRAVALGRKAKDWEWYIRAYVRLGILRYELGDYPRARKYALRAANKAGWSGHDTLGGMAYHDLLAVAVHTGTFQQGERYAARALELYPIKFDRVRHLAHDYALFLARRACYSVAMPILNAIEPLFGPGDPMRVLWLATTAEVAAALRNRPLFDRLSAEVLAVVQATEEHAAIALLRVADGFRRFGLWTDAEVLAVRSLELALKRSEGEPQRGAYTLLDDISERKAGVQDRPPPPHAQVTRLVPALLARLLKQHRLGILSSRVLLEGQ
jgi:tetratricopeptide (TPR) repeat protein